MPPEVRSATRLGAMLVGCVALVALAALLISRSSRDGWEGSNGRFVAGALDDFAIHEPVFFEEGPFWLIRQTDDTFIALYARDPFRGCTVPWRDSLRFVDPRTGATRDGWFRDACHGSTYDMDGRWVGGVSERDMDAFPVEVESGRVIVRLTTRDLMRGEPICVRTETCFP